MNQLESEDPWEKIASSVKRFPRHFLLLVTSIVSIVVLFVEPCFGRSKSFDNIIAFGDSLTDVGNVAGVTEQTVAPGINGYYQKTHF